MNSVKQIEKLRRQTLLFSESLTSLLQTITYPFGSGSLSENRSRRTGYLYLPSWERLGNSRFDGCLGA